jgi:heme-degrading monooxygenase HmoA
MAVIRQGIFKSIDTADYQKLPNFVHELRTHNMYRAIVEDLISRQGFIKKEYIMRETKAGQEFISQIVFEDQETFDAYMKSEEIISLWEYLKISADMNDLTFDIEDSVC